MAARVQYRQPAAPQPRGQAADVRPQHPLPAQTRPPPQSRSAPPPPGQPTQGLSVKLYRIEQYQAMWNYFSGHREPKIEQEYRELMSIPKGMQLQENLNLYWEEKTKQGKSTLNRDDFFEWVGRYEMDRPNRNAALGYNSSDDEDDEFDGEGDYDSDSDDGARGCCG